MLRHRDSAYEDGNWRLTRIDSGQKIFDLEASVLLRRLHDEERSSPDEKSAVETLRSINTALVYYQSQYSEVGFPEKLSSLAPANQGEPNSDHADLLESSIACPQSPCRHKGYLFDYELHSDGSYRVTARPERFGRTGTRSFYADESGVIRYTDEDRPATEDDPPLP